MCARSYTIVVLAHLSSTSFNGLECIRLFREWELRNNAKLGRPHQYVCCVVDHQNVTSRICIEAGMDDVIRRPYNATKLHTICSQATIQQAAKDGSSPSPHPVAHIQSSGKKYSPGYPGYLGKESHSHHQHTPMPQLVASMLNGGVTDSLGEIEIAAARTVWSHNQMHQAFQGSTVQPDVNATTRQNAFAYLLKAADDAVGNEDFIVPSLEQHPAYSESLAPQVKVSETQSLSKGVKRKAELPTSALELEVQSILQSASGVAEPGSLLEQLLPGLHVPSSEMSANCILNQAISSIGHGNATSKSSLITA